METTTMIQDFTCNLVVNASAKETMQRISQVIYGGQKTSKARQAN